MEGRLMVMLPGFKGYTVDFRLKEFRKAKYPLTLEFIPFDSKKGEKLLEEMGEKIIDISQDNPWREYLINYQGGYFWYEVLHKAIEWESKKEDKT
jgi:hypothetical protein